MHFVPNNSVLIYQQNRLKTIIVVLGASVDKVQPLQREIDFDVYRRQILTSSVIFWRLKSIPATLMTSQGSDKLTTMF